MCQDTRFVDADPLFAAAFGKLETETALADAGLTDDAHNTTICLDGIFEFKDESGKLVCPAGEGAQPPSAAKHSARGSVLKPAELQYLNGGRDPANGLEAQRLDLHELFGGIVGLFRNQNGTCISQLLQAIGQVHICAGGIIGSVNPVLYRLNNDFTGVNTDADLQIRIAEPCYPILHGQRREAATHGVILMRLWGAKYCHDPVALGFVDDARRNERRLHS